MSTVPAQTEGKIDFIYCGETFHTFYKLYGNITNCSKHPLVVTHGGPGLTNDYLVPHSDLTTKYDIPVILYDQIGNGQSTHLKDKPADFWTLELFIDELENLIKHFNIQNGFSILGHSWGGILASEFEVRRQPSGLKCLILANSLAASSLWNQSNMQLLQAFPPDVIQGMSVGMREPQKFWVALQKFHAVHGCTVKPVPAEFTNTMLQVFGPEGDPTVASAP
ncbi:L-amino acid amidase [Leucoagaricus sp. SymC.cos]|nr:L-amino acid amidase [Leucoagaricus sp. SymC.cos]